MRVLGWLQAAAVAGFAHAQQRLPVPDAAQLAAVEPQLSACVAAESGPGPAPLREVAQRLVARARFETAPLRYALLRQALDHAVREGDVAVALRAADTLEAAFELPPQRAAVLTLLESAGCAAPQALASAQLEHAVRIAGRDAEQFTKSLAHAERIAAADDPPGLRAAVTARCATLRQLVARAAYEEPAAAATLAAHPRLLIGGMANVEPTFTVDDDLVALARIGERRLSASAREADPLLRIDARRRALSLLKPLARTNPDDANDRLEVLRVRRLVDHTAALAVEPGVGALRFEQPADLGRLRIDGGRWRIEPGELRGESLGAGVETRATVRFAWHRIDSITIRGGVVSVEDCDFWIAAGTVEVLLSRHGANVVWFGEERIPVVPGVLQPRREHVVVLRQCGGEVSVAVDGRILRSGVGDLGGTVSVYPANGSEIFVRAIDIVGEVDLAKVVRGPEGADRVRPGDR